MPLSSFDEMNALVWLLTVVRSTVLLTPTTPPLSPPEITVRSTCDWAFTETVPIGRPPRFRLKLGFTCELAMKACVVSFTVFTETTPPMPTSPPEAFRATSVSPVPLGLGCSVELAHTSTSPLAAATVESSIYARALLVMLFTTTVPAAATAPPATEPATACNRSVAVALTSTCSSAVTEEAAI